MQFVINIYRRSFLAHQRHLLYFFISSQTISSHPCHSNWSWKYQIKYSSVVNLKLINYICLKMLQSPFIPSWLPFHSNRLLWCNGQRSQLNRRSMHSLSSSNKCQNEGTKAYFIFVAADKLLIPFPVGVVFCSSMSSTFFISSWTTSSHPCHSNRLWDMFRVSDKVQ